MGSESNDAKSPLESSPTVVDLRLHQPISSKIKFISVGLIMLFLFGSIFYLVYLNIFTKQLKRNEVSNPHEAIVSVSVSPKLTPTPTLSKSNSLNGWQQYDNSNAKFSIKYPSSWSLQELDSTIVFGPPEIGEDTIWGVQYFDSSKKNRFSIIDSIGKQFTDRIQSEEFIRIKNLPAVKVVTTTKQVKDWYSVVIIFETKNRIYALENGAQTDANLNLSLFTRTGRKDNLKFEDFYNSFISHEYASNGIFINHYLGIKLRYPKSWSIIDNYENPMTNYVASIGTPLYKEFIHEADAFLVIEKLSDIGTFPKLDQMVKGRGDKLGAKNPKEYTMGTVPGIMIYYSDTTGSYQEFIFRSGSLYVGIRSPLGTTHQETITEILESLEISVGI